CPPGALLARARAAREAVVAANQSASLTGNTAVTTKTRDRRVSDRVTMWTPVQLTAPDGAAPAALKNLSVAGLCCTTARAFPEMTLVKIVLDLPAKPVGDAEHVRLELNGAVVRCLALRHGTGK